MCTLTCAKCWAVVEPECDCQCPNMKALRMLEIMDGVVTNLQGKEVMKLAETCTTAFEGTEATTKDMIEEGKARYWKNYDEYRVDCLVAAVAEEDEIADEIDWMDGVANLQEEGWSRAESYCAMNSKHRDPEYRESIRPGPRIYDENGEVILENLMQRVRTLMFFNV